ncbi:MAG: hypothetical protein JNM22_06415 [Saprospiraceae bacterium]|nr:hypothetical protein [Saprospiraceae bacterium]
MMPELLLLSEHTNEVHALPLPADQAFFYKYPHQKKDTDAYCFRLRPEAGGHRVETSYFIGVDWIGNERQAIFVQPKLNQGGFQTDFLRMLSTALRHPDVAEYTKDLFVIRFDQPAIDIYPEHDLLTPLLAVQFLSTVRAIVKRGLKKSYYRVERRLNGRVKGKIHQSSSIRQQLLDSNALHMHCSFDEFGIDSPENRLLKKALAFVQRYLPTVQYLHAAPWLQELLRYTLPAFEQVSDVTGTAALSHQKNNVFYPEYAEAIRLARLLLQRFGYHLSNVRKTDMLHTPPFWIDMSKLFELYVLGLLKDRFPGPRQVLYHYTASGNELDFVLHTPEYQMVVDAKYKPRYAHGFSNDDIRQVSGYARSKYVYRKLGKTEHDVIDCLIVYPDSTLRADGLQGRDLKAERIGAYVGMYKMGVGVPGRE